MAVGGIDALDVDVDRPFRRRTAGVRERRAQVAALTEETRGGSIELGVTGGILITAAAAVWTALIAGVTVWRHNQFLSHRFDLGNMVQAVWSTTQGRPLEMTDDGTAGEQLVRLGAHMSTRYSFSTFRSGSSTRNRRTLIIAQAAALAAGIYPVVQLCAQVHAVVRWRQHSLERGTSSFRG